MEKIADAFLPTRFGKFRIYAFKADDNSEHVALVACTHPPHPKIPVRVHSKCLTGDTLGSLRCDCRAQLEQSLRYMKKKRCGIFIYLDQEGRGIGLSNKIKAYALQDKGFDTVEANEKLGFHNDLRDYSIAAEILRYLGVNDISLLTNNPKKVSDLELHGIKVSRRIPVIAETNKYNKKYMEVKRKKMHHLLSVNKKEGKI